MCKHGKGHMISHCSKCIDWFSREPVEHSFEVTTFIKMDGIHQLVKFNNVNENRSNSRKEAILRSQARAGRSWFKN